MTDKGQEDDRRQTGEEKGRETKSIVEK